MPQSDSPSPLDVTATLTGKRILFVGTTGFVGKVALSMLLYHYGENLAHIYVVMRRGNSLNAPARFYERIATSQPFQPLCQKFGGHEALVNWLKTQCTVLEGDITAPWLGIEADKARGLKGQLDVIINCAGLVNFNPPLEVGLRVNTYGVKHLVDACLYLDVPLVHVSTAFVAGNRSGLIFEDEAVEGFFPKRNATEGVEFNLKQELADCEKAVRRLREQAEDRMLASEFRHKAIERLKEEGRNFRDEKVLRLAMGREKRLWLTLQLAQAGMERAHKWGWPNTYTYTKSLGEQILAATPKLRFAIARPSIVESARHYPCAGWNEGFTTSAPLIYALLKGQGVLPASDKAVLDMIPVDLVASSLIAITAQQLRVRERRVYQQASGDTAPFIASRSVELTGLYKRRYYRNAKVGNARLNSLRSRVEPKAVSNTTFRWMSSPMLSKGVRWLHGQIDRHGPSWGAPRITAALTHAKERLNAIADTSDSINNIVNLFLPFMWANEYIFRCDNTRALYEGMPAEDKAKINWNPQDIDWRTYFLETHTPGLEKWVFPTMDAETKKRKVVHAHRDLLELFEGTVQRWRHRVAFRMYENHTHSRFTFGEVHCYAARVGSFLARTGIGDGARVMLVSENRPEWGIAFFGVLRAGATAVPIDKEWSENEIVNAARRAEVKACLVSEKVAEKLPQLQRSLREAGVSAQVYPLSQAMSGDDSQPDGIGRVKHSTSPDDVASLIFSSGTMHNPKGVMLTHRNFASLVSKLAGIFEIGVGDGVLSVLPLHHVFEFSAGFLTPFSRGAEVAYIDELTEDAMGHVLESGRITGMVGVPAMWNLFHRKITQEYTSHSGVVAEATKALMGVNAYLRNSQGFNIGKLLFWPVHRKLGGHIKFLVSGGAALSPEVHEAFHALGFNLHEGYGLTEAAPVLTVTPKTEAYLEGTVGEALPGVEVHIHAPNANGIGEVIAKGPNVMAGYFQDSAGTQAVVKDGWLYTGDLGRLDEKGRLFLVGRKKDVIIDSTGENVYPDELEGLYGGHTHIQELSIVGLPAKGEGEKIACLCVPNYKGKPEEEVRQLLEAHFRTVSSSLPAHRRVKVLHLWDGQLERTATHKVKRTDLSQRCSA